MKPASERLAAAIDYAKGAGILSRNSNPIDVLRFSVVWLLDQVDQIHDRLDDVRDAQEDDGK